MYYYLVYTSYSKQTPTENDLLLLLKQSRERNKRSDVTGILLYFNGRYMGHLEGHEKDVKMVYAEICADERHTRTRVIDAGPVAQRIYTDWVMNFKSANPEKMKGIEGFREL